MAQDSVSDLLFELLFFSSFFFSFVAIELLCVEYPWLKTSWQSFLGSTHLYISKVEPNHFHFAFFTLYCILPWLKTLSLIFSSNCCSVLLASFLLWPSNFFLHALLYTAMAQDSVSDLLFELYSVSDLLFELLFFSFVAIELLCVEYPFFSALFFQHEGDHHEHVPFTVAEYPQCSWLSKFINPFLIISRPKINSSSLLLLSSSSSSSASSSSSSSGAKPETEHAKSAIKIEEHLEVICEICAETKRSNQMIKSQTCQHSYCSDCMTKHVATKIQDSITAVACPGLGCKSVYELETCRPWIPKDLLERWDKARCEALFLQVPKFYCPFKDCSAMMLVEDEMDQLAALETECPVCHRLFCARCNVPWHQGVDCDEYQKLNENERQREDLLVRQLAKDKKWGRCPKCKFFVEKTQGCLHITCRCKYEFCYACGQKWSSFHGGCQRY